jgi:hypothetical protein
MLFLSNEEKSQKKHRVSVCTEKISFIHDCPECFYITKLERYQAETVMVPVNTYTHVHAYTHSLTLIQK